VFQVKLQAIILGKLLDVKVTIDFGNIGKTVINFFKSLFSIAQKLFAKGEEEEERKLRLGLPLGESAFDVAAKKGATCNFPLPPLYVPAPNAALKKAKSNDVGYLKCMKAKPTSAPWGSDEKASESQAAAAKEKDAKAAAKRTIKCDNELKARMKKTQDWVNQRI
jgi:hypothetical protein